MIDYSNPFLFFLRTLGQRLGIFAKLRPLLNLIERLRRRKYEGEIQSALVNHIHPGQVIWDIGANEGFYVDLLLELIGRDGIIVAFEPSPEVYDTLKQKFSGYPNVHLENVALSDKDGVGWFFQSATPVTSSLVYSEHATSKIQVSVKRGDSYAIRYFPDVIKIDVEGYEYEVLKGMPQILNSPKLKCIVLEVHFSILQQRGLRNAAKSIVHMLTEAGFVVRWTDRSHLLASRI
jgi:FkbM family methyltransferase